MPATLYVVSTPIGNLEDITLRALKTLKTVALIAAEDTRRTSILLRHFGITTPTTSLHEHNERQKIPALLGRLRNDEDIALLSDAGTPVVADPGQRLILAAADDGIRVVPIPGPSAVLAALSASGFPADSFVFAGFAPSRAGDRTKWLRTLSEDPRTIVFFEVPHRIRRLLQELPHIFGNRPIIIARELTKLHEEVIRSNTVDLSSREIREKGEFTIVLGPHQAAIETSQVPDDAAVVDMFYQLTNNGAGRRAAISKVATVFGLSAKYVYGAIERLKSGSGS
jgi:16S rRNA (cytidine1402-2'-O)-methyltransferase